MVRKMAYVGFSYMIGLFFASFFISKINIIIATAVLLCGIGGCIFFRKNKLLRSKIIVISSCIAAAILVSALYTELRYQKVVDYNGKSVSFEGTPEKIKYINNDMMYITAKGYINNNTKVNVNILTDATDIDYNDTLFIEGKAQSVNNSYSFSSLDYYKAKGVFLSFSYPEQMNVIRDNSFSLKNAVSAYRERIQNVITSSLTGEEGAFLYSMLSGDKSGLDVSFETDFYRCGTGHILAVSGTHLMIISALILFVLKKLRLSNGVVFSVTTLFVILFCFFASFSVSVIRSAVMYEILLSGILFKRRSDVLNSLGFAGLVITLINPFAIRDVSFLLSFSGTFGVGVFAPWLLSEINIRGKYASVIKAFLTSVCICVCTLPFSIMYFDEVSLAAPLMNLILLPLCSVSLICGAVIALTGGIAVLSQPLLLIAGLLLRTVKYIAELVGSLWFCAVPTGYDFLLYAVIIATGCIVSLAFIYRKKKVVINYLVSAVFIISVLFGVNTFLQKDNVVVSAFTQDSSCCVCVSNNDTTIVLDLAGKGQADEAMKRYLVRTGRTDVGIVCKDENCQSLVSRYLSDSNIDVGSFCLYKNTADTGGLSRVINLESDASISCGELYITVQNGNIYTIRYGGLVLICSGNNDIIEDSAFPDAIVFLYRNKQPIVSINDKVYTYSCDENGASAVSLTINKNGEYDVRRIEYAMRE